MTTKNRVLVVDDDLANRFLASEILTAAGYSVIDAENGEMALTLFIEQSPDLVLLDVMMPGWDGFETCRRMRAVPGGEDAAIVFATALSDGVSHQRAMESGADDFLTKPINRTELLLRVRSLLRIKKLNRELRDGHEVIRVQRDALVAAQKHREELTSLVVHDLKSPLTIILFTAEWLGEMCTGEEAQAAGQIATSAQAMHRMVMNLLDISRSEDGMLTPRLAKVDLGALAEKAVRSWKAHFGAKPLEVVAEPLIIDADSDLLGRLIENLVDNANKYSPPASAVRLSVERIDEAWVEISILDHGAGIPVAQREKIFEKYVRLSPEADHARHSRGLGLTFCRLAAEVHGGRIWVDDGKQGGSCFHVRLPISQGPQAVVH